MSIEHINIIVLAVGSEGEKSRKLAESYGLEYFEYKNLPIDEKFDAGIFESQKYNPDYVTLVGHDDMITGSYFDRAISYLSNGADCIGLLDCYIVDYERHRMHHWSGYPDYSIGWFRKGNQTRHGEAIAAGKVFGKNILHKMQWTPFDSNKSFAEDISDDERSVDKLNSYNALVKNIRMADCNCDYWNVKEGTVLNPIKVFYDVYPETLKDVTYFNQEFWPYFDYLKYIES